MKDQITEAFELFLVEMILQPDLADMVMRSHFSSEEDSERASALVAFRKVFDSLLSQDRPGTLRDPEMSYLFFQKQTNKDGSTS